MAAVEAPTQARDLDEPSLTQAQAEARLPNRYRDGDNPIWTAEDEQRLQESWTARDQAILDLQSSATQESALWKVSLQIYNCHPYDLFRYGLKFDDSAADPVKVPDELGGPGPCPGYMTAAACETLKTVMCHGLWGSDIAPLRYVLQIAVMLRVPGHIKPITPFRPVAEATHLARRLRELGKGKESAYITFLEHMINSPENKSKIREMCSLLEAIVQPDDPIESADGAPLAREQVLFLLQHKDIVAVKTVLGRIRCHGQPYPTCETYYDRQFSNLEDREEGAFPPWRTELMKQWKKQCALAMRREWLVAQRYWIRDGRQQGDATLEGGFGYDVAHGDGYPCHIDYAPFECTPDHVRLIRGLIWPLSNTPPPEDWLDWRAASTGSRETSAVPEFPRRHNRDGSQEILESPVLGNLDDRPLPQRTPTFLSLLLDSQSPSQQVNHVDGRSSDQQPEGDGPPSHRSNKANPRAPKTKGMRTRGVLYLSPSPRIS
ncbi:hypothetical protein NEMBOFW57_006515 [Staphylotrichum longicolle]|uniref:Uncharacterized protein n=1 Tax=Staphylotrichum longicolle TaxID=669026 RepID=A0AAD4ETQ9_9PEZI|nr:hypothetical protein NEMBOFW57_006515 [Staphylotrichum longicolle]